MLRVGKGITLKNFDCWQGDWFYNQRNVRWLKSSKFRWNLRGRKETWVEKSIDRRKVIVSFDGGYTTSPLTDIVCNFLRRSRFRSSFIFFFISFYYFISFYFPFLLPLSFSIFFCLFFFSFLAIRRERRTFSIRLICYDLQDVPRVFSNSHALYFDETNERNISFYVDVCTHLWRIYLSYQVEIRMFYVLVVLN